MSAEIFRPGSPFAVVDIGSNTVKLSVFICTRDGTPHQILHCADTVRIGHDMSLSGQIAEDRAIRLIESLLRMESIARENGAGTLMGVATEAFRRAANGGEVRNLIHQSTGWHIEIISGQQETELTLEAARPFVSAGVTTVIADIGGASTEIILVGDNGSLVSSGSIPLGSGSLFDELIHASPPPPGTLERAFLHARQMLSDVVNEPEPPAHLLLPGGSGHLLQELIRHIPGDSVLDRAGFELLHEWLATRHAVDTAGVLDIQVERAQVLPASLAVAEALEDVVRPVDVRAIPSGVGFAVANQMCVKRFTGRASA